MPQRIVALVLLKPEGAHEPLGLFGFPSWPKIGDQVEYYGVGRVYEVVHISHFVIRADKLHVEGNEPQLVVYVRQATRP